MENEHSQVKTLIATEAALWATKEPIAKQAFGFWNTFLVLREGVSNDQALSGGSEARFLCIIRAVSWVESLHGTGSGNQPAKDPMQVGNPRDLAWKQFSGQVVNGDRFVRGPGATPNYYANQLPEAVKDLIGEARIDKLQDLTKGHNDPNYNQVMSYYWGIAFLIHKTNTESSISGGLTYKCGDCSIERMKKGAVAYNGGGDTDYGRRINEAIGLTNCMS